MEKHRKNCESCQSQVTMKVKFKCQFCPFGKRVSRQGREKITPWALLGEASRRRAQGCNSSDIEECYNQECSSIVNSPSMRGRDRKVEGRPSEVALLLEIQKAESGPNPELYLGKPKGMHVLSDQ